MLQKTRLLLDRPKGDDIRKNLRDRLGASPQTPGRKLGYFLDLSQGSETGRFNSIKVNIINQKCYPCW
jgi:hypothetical protein